MIHGTAIIILIKHPNPNQHREVHEQEFEMCDYMKWNKGW